MNDWRNNPTTEARKSHLKEEGIKFHRNITKGEASYLVGSTVEPEDDEIEILKFFKV